MKLKVKAKSVTMQHFVMLIDGRAHIIHQMDDLMSDQILQNQLATKFTTVRTENKEPKTRITTMLSE